jgi:uncharacterized protein YraI
MTLAQIRRTAGRTTAVVLTAAGVLLAGALPAGAAVSGTVQTAGDPLTVRRAPDTSATAVRTVANGATVAIDCQTTGTSVTGPLGTTTLWDYVPALGGYVSDGYVKTGSDGQVAPDCGVGSGSAECSSGDCAGEGLFRASDGHFLVYDKVSDGKSAVVAYWLPGGVGPLYAWNSGGAGTNTDRATGVSSGDWIYYKVCIANYSATAPTLENCSGGLTDYAA